MSIQTFKNVRDANSGVIGANKLGNNYRKFPLAGVISAGVGALIPCDEGTGDAIEIINGNPCTISDVTWADSGLLFNPDAYIDFPAAATGLLNQFYDRCLAARFKISFAGSSGNHGVQLYAGSDTITLRKNLLTGAKSLQLVSSTALNASQTINCDFPEDQYFNLLLLFRNVDDVTETFESVTHLDIFVNGTLVGTSAVNKKTTSEKFKLTNITATASATLNLQGFAILAPISAASNNGRKSAADINKAAQRTFAMWANGQRVIDPFFWNYT